MTNQEFWEIATRIAVIVFYAAAFISGLVAVHQSKAWARRRSGIAIVGVSSVWLGFYLYLVDQSIHHVAPVVVWSRACHYMTAAGLIAMAYSIISAERLRPPVHITLTLEDVEASC